MTYKQLILTVDDEAQYLSRSAYKVLWRLIAFAIRRETLEVRASHRELAAGLKLSKEGTSKAIRQLAEVLDVSPGDGLVTTFLLPAELMPEQRTLFSDDEGGGVFHNRTGFQDTTVPETRTPLSWKPGHHRTGFWDRCTGNQDTTVPDFGTGVPETRTDRTGFQDTSHVRPIRNAGARGSIDRIKSSATAKLVQIIDRALASVEIPEEKEAEAALLSEALHAYKCDLGPSHGNALYVDSTILAQCLALASYEELSCVLRSLRERGKQCGIQDSWFFTVLAQQIHGVPPQLTASRRSVQKPRKTSYESKPSLFGEDLVKATAAGVRKLG